MNPNFRNFAIWIVILFMLLALFQVFQQSTGRAAPTDKSYSQFVSDVDAGSGRIIRVDPAGVATVLATDLAQPTGLAVSANGSTLFVSDSARARWIVWSVDAWSSVTVAFLPGRMGLLHGLALISLV